MSIVNVEEENPNCSSTDSRSERILGPHAFVSSENTSVSWENDGYFVRDLPESRNGTTLNLKPLPKGAKHPLASGDLEGASRLLPPFKE